MSYKRGDLVRFRYSGRLATVMRGEYTARFIDAQDHDLIDHGMGHLAGSYGGAVDVCYVDTPNGPIRKQVKLSAIELVSRSEQP